MKDTKILIKLYPKDMNFESKNNLGKFNKIEKKINIDITIITINFFLFFFFLYWVRQKTE